MQNVFLKAPTYICKKDKHHNFFQMGKQAELAFDKRDRKKRLTNM